MCIKSKKMASEQLGINLIVAESVIAILGNSDKKLAKKLDPFVEELKEISQRINELTLVHNEAKHSREERRIAMIEHVADKVADKDIDMEERLDWQKKLKKLTDKIK